MKTKLVIFGITGHLSRTKLLPALNNIFATGDYDDMEIIGVSRRQINMSKLLKESIGDAKLAKKFQSFTMDLAEPKDYKRLKRKLVPGRSKQILIYLAVPPGASAAIVDNLGEAGINTPNVKLLFEKPFGFDLASAEDYLSRTARYFSDKQIFRIDHYAAKEIARHIVNLRELHKRWNNKTIASVEVIASESTGIDGRAEFYEQTGALRDFVQGHLLQILALVIMDLPKPGKRFNFERLPKLRLAALNFIKPANPELSTRGQYSNYSEEVDNPGSQTETFVQLQLESDAPKWRGVPLFVTTGKALDLKRSYVVIHYKDGSQSMCDEETIESIDHKKLDAYERVLIEAIAGRKSLFISGEEVLREWQIVAPVQDSWNMGQQPLKIYPSGSTAQEVVDIK